MPDIIGDTAGQELIARMDALTESRSTPPTLGDGAQLVNDAATKNITQIFEHAMGRIVACRHGLDAMEAALVSKRNSLTDSLHAYIVALEVIETQTQAMQVAVGDAIVAQDGVG